MWHKQNGCLDWRCERWEWSTFIAGDWKSAAQLQRKTPTDLWVISGKIKAVVVGNHHPRKQEDGEPESTYSDYQRQKKKDPCCMFDLLISVNLYWMKTSSTNTGCPFNPGVVWKHESKSGQANRMRITGAGTKWVKSGALTRERDGRTEQE